MAQVQLLNQKCQGQILYHLDGTIYSLLEEKRIHHQQKLDFDLLFEPCLYFLIFWASDILSPFRSINAKLFLKHISKMIFLLFQGSKKPEWEKAKAARVIFRTCQ